jgi:hypothetical protein
MILGSFRKSARGTRSVRFARPPAAPKPRWASSLRERPKNAATIMSSNRAAPDRGVASTKPPALHVSATSPSRPADAKCRTARRLEPHDPRARDVIPRPAAITSFVRWVQPTGLIPCAVGLHPPDGWLTSARSGQRRCLDRKRGAKPGHVVRGIAVRDTRSDFSQLTRDHGLRTTPASSSAPP